MKFLIALFLLCSNFALADAPRESSVLNREAAVLKDELDLEDADLSTQNALIEKLELVLPDFADERAKANELRLRLADLYSDRARIKDYQSNNCEKCDNGAQDRKKAIEYYEKIKQDSKNLGHVLLQLAHLYRMEEKVLKSQDTFYEILKNKSLKEHHIKAHFGLADIAFQKAAYKNAKAEYTAASKTEVIDEKIYVLYRLAWCELNTGRNKQAIEYIQKALEVAKQNSKTSWQKDLMGDYATILSHEPFTNKDIETYISFSEPTTRLANFKFLAQEADRLGNKKGALLIWTEYSKEAKSVKNAKDGAEVQFKLAESFYDLNDYKECQNSLDEVVSLINKKKCENCAQVTKDFRSLLVTWSKKEKIEGSSDLVEAYKKYLTLVPTDYEAIIWAAQVARSAKNIKQAILYYEQAAKLSKSNPKNLEATTSSILELGSEVKNSPAYQLALQKYLELNPKGEKRFLVRYELAYLEYKNKKYDQSSSQFEVLASESSWDDQKSKLQAAELSLESFAKLGKNSEVFRAARKYEKIFTSRALHFAEIARKITVNNLATLIPQNKTDEIREQLKVLNTFSVDQLEAKDRSIHFRSQILAAEKINDLGMVESASNNMLNTKPVSNYDRELALKSLLWVYELRLDFKKAFSVAQHLPMPELTTDQRYLKLGLLAELANENSSPYYEKYVKAAHSLEDANRVRLIMIRSSSNPWRMFESLQKLLIKTPELYSSIILELHLKNPDWNRVKSALQVRGVSKTPAGSYMAKLVAREKFAKLPSETGNINGKRLTQSIQTRVQYLKSLQAMYKRTNSDLTLQLLILNKIANENSKFHRQLSDLPPPSALKSKEIAMYQTALAEQSRPFLLAAEQATQTKAQLIDNLSKHLNELFDAVESGEQFQKHIAVNEFNSLKPFLTKKQINGFEEKLENSSVNANKVKELREQISRNPLDPSPLIQLRGLEAKRSDGPLLAYLDQRISQLKMRARR